MKKIRINFVGFWYGFDYRVFPIYRMLTEMYDVEISPHPDFLFYSCFGENNFDELDYDCVRIFYSGENASPDFNRCDYAIGYDNITYNDRYCRCPLFVLYEPVEKAVHKHENVPDDILTRKPEFCNFIVGNSTGMPQRAEMFHLMDARKPVASVGTFLNNRGGFTVDTIPQKIAFQEKCRFSITFESVCQPDFITEKIMQAFAARTIPLYLGDPSIGEIFNEKAFIDCRRFPSLAAAADEALRLDADPDACLAMLREPCFVDPDYVQHRLDALRAFLQNVFEQGPQEAFRRPRYSIPQRHCDDVKAYLNLKRNIRFQRYLAAQNSPLVRAALRLAKPKNTP